MQKILSDIEFLFPNKFDLENFKKLKPDKIFSSERIHYLNELSKQLNNDTRLKNYPDVAAFSFFCRKGNIQQLKNTFMKSNSLALGRGIVFHIAPSNVPVNFAFSLIGGLLSGNSNIVRVSSKRFEQVEIIIDAIRVLNRQKKHSHVSKRLAIVRYDRNSEGTSFFSSICDVRLIWGGDETIKQIRKSVLPPRSFDITFSDRYSICVINADEFVNETHPEKIAMRFYNDTYFFDQNACTSPHLVIWLGENKNVKSSQNIFWKNLHDLVKSEYLFQSVFALDKITAFFNHAISQPEIKLTDYTDNSLLRIKIENLHKDIDTFRCNSGYFSEYYASSLEELSSIITRKYQTLSYYGISKNNLQDFVETITPFGIDRIVPIGGTMDFSLIWDGYSLVETLSRKIEIL